MINSRYLFKQRPYHNWVGVLLSLMLILAFRIRGGFQSFYTNYWLLNYKQFPLWQPIADSDSPLYPSLPLLSPDQYSDNLSLARSYGITLYSQGQFSKAVEIWQAAEILPSEVLSIQARYALSIGQQNVAINWYKLAVEVDPHSSPSWHALGDLYKQTSSIDLSIEAYEEAVALGNTASVDPLAKLWRDQGDHSKAIDIWTTALNQYPNAVERLSWWQGSSNSYRALAEWEMGLFTAQQGLIEYPEDARLFIEKGAIIYGKSGNTETALNLIEKAISLDPTLATAYSTMGSILATEKRFDEAYAFYSTAIEHNPQMQSWYVARAYAAQETGNLALATQSYHEIIENFPDFLPAYIELASIYHQLGEKDNAVQVINRVLKSNGDLSSQDYVVAGEIYEWQGDIDSAIFAYQQALNLDSENLSAITSLQRILEK